jgi:DNA-binding MarR family transcriptional regulator
LSDSSQSALDRGKLERSLLRDIGDVASAADSLSRDFAAQHGMSYNDFRALVFTSFADAAGHSMSAGELRGRIGLSGAAISYLIDRMTETGYLRTMGDPADGRKVILVQTDRGTALVRIFLAKVAEQCHRTLEALTDGELAAAHRTFTTMLEGMGAFLVAQRSSEP